MTADILKLNNLKSNVEKYMLEKYQAGLSLFSGHPNFRGGWLDHNPMWHGVATGFFVYPLDGSKKFLVNLNKTTGKFTVYQHTETIQGEVL